jgi:hypothetical protein
LRDLEAEIRVSQGVTACDTDSEALLHGTRGLALAAQATGYYAYGCLCLNLAEQIEELRYEGHSSKIYVSRLNLWVEHSSRYLRQPADPFYAMVLLEALEHPLWGAPLDRVEKEVLYLALLANNWA